MATTEDESQGNGFTSIRGCCGVYVHYRMAPFVFMTARFSTRKHVVNQTSHQETPNSISKQPRRLV
jgi:hypothetical protein